MSGPGPGSGGPFYFHYVTDSTVAFSSACYTEDELIFSFRVGHDEGQIPVLELEIQNPGVGLLSAGRLTWVWFSWWNGTSVVPLFFGRLVGVPSDLFKQVITVQFIARADDFIARKQAVAETLKIAPYYDPVLLDDSHRDDPDAILEGWSANYHVDRTSLDWSISDVLVGEDGTVTFTGDQAFYDSLSFRIGQPPFTAIRVDMTANWNQVVSGGSINLAPWNFQSATGAAIIDQWPKPGTSLGGGWYVANGAAYDVLGIKGATNITSSYHWTNEASVHVEGDTMSLTQSFSRPSFEPNNIADLFWAQLQKDVKTSGVGHSSEDAEWLIEPVYSISAFLTLQYQANRQRAEYLTFTLQSDLQAVLTDPTVQQDSEVLTLRTAKLSDPLYDPKNWTVLAGQAVAVGQICFPNAPLLPGQTSYQICVAAGTAGAAQPTFSDVIGATTADGSVTWACLGASLPAIPDWSPSMAASLGTIIAPSMPVWIYYSALLNSGVESGGAGVQVQVGQIIRTDDNSSFQMCTMAGVTTSAFWGANPTFAPGWTSPPAFSPVWGTTTVDGTVQWTSLGPAIPVGAFQLCVQAGVSAEIVPPPWSATPGNVITDGTIHWMSLGASGPSLSIPAGGQVGNVAARSYFPTDRGRQSLEYGIMRARAVMRQRARCVEIGWQAPFAAGVALSCRMNATIEDPRLPGGTATGKIVSYALSCDGDSGEALANVRIGCAVGNANAVAGALGTGVYAASGYMQSGYQQMSAATVLPASGDVGYTPPLDNPNDDGLTFPLTADQVVTANAIVDNSAETHYSPSQYLDLELKPVTGASFVTVYSVITTALQVPKQIDMAA